MRHLIPLVLLCCGGCQSESPEAAPLPLEVESARYLLVNGFPQMEVVFVSTAEQAIAGVGFEASVTSPGRSVPWRSRGVAHPIEGGIEPGERHAATIYLSDRNWGGLPDRQDLVLEVVVRELEYADGSIVTGYEYAQAP